MEKLAQGNLKKEETKKSFYLDKVSDLQISEFVSKIDTSLLASDFYKNYVLPTFNFPNEQAYYQEASASSYIHNIKVPTLCLFAEDDPIVPSKAYLKWSNENVVVAITAGSQSPTCS